MFVVAIISAALAAVAVIISVRATKAARRSADAAEGSLKQAEKSADATVAYAKSAEEATRIAAEQHRVFELDRAKRAADPA